jgi:hypothetical protein
MISQGRSDKTRLSYYPHVDSVFKPSVAVSVQCTDSSHAGGLDGPRTVVNVFKGIVNLTPTSLASPLVMETVIVI